MALTAAICVLYTCCVTLKMRQQGCQFEKIITRSVVLIYVPNFAVLKDKSV
jgi:hypothetical protein